MKKIILLMLMLLAMQAPAQKFFRQVDSPDGRVSYPEDRMPTDYVLYKVDRQQLLQYISTAPDQFGGRTSDVLIDVPLPDGRVIPFLMYRAHPMSAELERHYPDILSFKGKQQKGNMTLRLDINPSGLYMAVYHTDEGRAIMQPYDTHGTLIYYYGKYQPGPAINCEVSDEGEEGLDLHFDTQQRPAFSDGILRTYRLAFATTGEFSSYHVQQAINNGTLSNNASDAQKKQAVLDAIVVIIDRVNEIYETDLSIHLNLVSGTEIIYLDPNNDPYTNDNASQLLYENQQNLDNVIGSANYDIGHVGTTGGGGLAGLGVVCRNGYKARGETGLPEPTGDHYAVDFVAHEMGHQFGANHTFANYCNGNRHDATAVEPGSGTTIMAYAGVCPPNVQNFSDPYFHYVSIHEIESYISNHDCSQHTILSNNPPTASFGPQKYIPKETPFILEVNASDPDGDVLTYTFDEVDVYHDSGYTDAAPSPTNTTGPLFRCLPATERNHRFYPKISDIVNGNYGNQWEVLPSVRRILSFRAVVRDNNTEGSQIATPYMALGVDTSAGPFRLTSQMNDEIWHPDSTVLITWNVAGTDGGNVNTTAVDILFSLTGDDDYDIVLASNVPNDGSQTITVPSSLHTPGGRLMIRGHDNYFFDISHGLITVGNYEEVCQQYSNNNALAIPDNDSNGVTSTIQITDSADISKLEVMINITHTYIQDLIITLTSPAGTTVDLFRRNCQGQDNIDVTFSDAGDPLDCNGMNAGNIYQPVGDLSDFHNENIYGTWTLFISDNANQDTGTLNSWSLKICHMELPVDAMPVEGLHVFPNPAGEYVNISLKAISSNQQVNISDMNGRLVFSHEYHRNGPTVLTIPTASLSTGIYLLRIRDGERVSTRKIVVK